MLSAIVCMDNFGGIGKDGDLLYKIPEDMKRFKELTIGHPVIMGRKTWNSIGNKPLKGRNNIVLSKTLNYSVESIKEDDGYITEVHINKDMREEEMEYLAEASTEYFVIGGQSIYEMFLPYCQKVYATIVLQFSTETDTFFPIELLNDDWEEIDKGTPYYSNNIGYVFGFKTYVRKKNAKQSDKSQISHAYSDPISGHDAVKNPSHYTSGKYPVIDFIEDQGLGYCLGNVIKYICRAGKKYHGDKQKELQDLNKAKWYLERRLEEHKNGIEQDSGNFKAEIKITDFIEDQKLNYARGEILRYAVSFEKPDDLEVYPKIALALLDAEIHRMEEQL